METLLIIMGAIVASAGTLPYVIALLRGTVRPRLVSWIVWAVLAGIMAVSSFMEGQMASMALSLVGFVSCSAIVVLGWRRHSLRMSRLDVGCLAGAALGILSLIIFQNPVQALIVAVAVDAVAYIPTLVHAWTHPDEESLACFALSSMGGALVLLAAIHSSAGFTGLLYPLYSVVFNGSMVILLIIGRVGPLLGYRYSGEQA